MKVLFCPAHVIYGSERGSELGWAFDLVDRLARRHPRSVVVVGRNEEGGLPYRVVEVDPHRHDVNLSPRGSAVFAGRYLRAARRLRRDEHFDVVHHVLPFALGRTLGLRPGDGRLLIGPVQAPLSYVGHDESGGGGSRVLAGVLPTLARLSDRHLGRAGAVVATNGEAESLVRARGVSAVSVVPPGVDTARWSPGPRRPSHRGPLRLLSATTFTERKAGDLLLDAVRQLLARHVAVRLTLLGDGPALPVLRSRIADLGLSAEVSAPGRVDPPALLAAYRDADLLVSMSRAESFATVVLEALACGLPVLATRVGGFREAVRDGEEGHLVDVDDVGGLAGHAQRLAAQPQALQEMRLAARRRALETYDWDDVVVPAYERALIGLAQPRHR